MSEQRPAIPTELRQRLEREEPELLREYDLLGAPNPDCPACTGKTTGEWMDLCDDCLGEWIAPALADNDARRRATR